MKPNEMITELRNFVMNQLITLTVGHTYSIDYLCVSTGIKRLYIEAILADLRDEKLVELDHRMNDSGMLCGSGYKLTNEGRRNINSVNYLKRKNEYWESVEKKRFEKKTWIERFFS